MHFFHINNSLETTTKCCWLLGLWLWQCGVHTVCKRRGVGVLWNGQKAGGLSLRVKRDERVGVGVWMVWM